MSDQINDTIPSTDFGAFTPQASTPAEQKDHEFLSMAGEAVRGSWQIPESEFVTLPKRLIELTNGKDQRTAIKAAKLLVDMNAQNSPAGPSESAGGVVIYLPDNGRGSRLGESGDGVVILPSGEKGVSDG